MGSKAPSVPDDWSNAPATVRRHVSKRRVRTRAGGFAALVVATAGLLRTAINVPFVTLPDVLGSWYEPMTTIAVVVPAVAAIVVAVLVRDDLVRVGLVAAGVFSCLAAIDPNAAIPASGILVAGAGLVLVPPVFDREIGSPIDIGREADTQSAVRSGTVVVQRIAAAVVALAFVFAIGLSLGATTGLLPTGIRPAGTTATLLGLAATPLAVRAPRRAVLVGCVVAVGTYVVGTTMPFVTGAVVLAVGAAIDPSLVLLALAAGGASATIASGLSSPTPSGLSRVDTRTPRPGRRVDVAIGGILLVAAGVPATVSRAIVVVLGGWFLLYGALELDRDRTTEPNSQESIGVSHTDDSGAGGENRAR